jgi:hypothetical protein
MAAQPASGKFLVIIATGGTGPMFVHNQAAPAIRRPGTQVTAVAPTYKEADDLAQAAFTRLTSVSNQVVNGIHHLRIVPLQEPFDGGPDQNGRARAIFNILVTRRN